jgi:hypothetical protein
MTTAREIVDKAVDWPALIALALGDPPKPKPLHDALQEWAAAFDVIENGWPLPADYPEAVRRFIRRLATVTRKGRPCRDERNLFAARKAWEEEMLRYAYQFTGSIAKMIMGTGGTWNGDKLTRTDKPSALARESVARRTGRKENSVDAIVNPRRRQ